MSPEQQQQYVAAQIRAINNELNELQLQYDTRYLATAMINRAVYMLRMLVAAGKWTDVDVQVVASEALADLHIPLDTQPRELTRGPNDLPT